MNITMIADTHSAQPPLPGGDLLIHAGDLTHVGTPAEIRAAAEWLGAQDYACVVAVAGNHDFGFQREPELTRDIMWEAGVMYLEDSGHEFQGLKIWGSPWSPTFGSWAFMGSERELAARWAMIPDDTDILVVHGPPYGHGDRTNRGPRVGSESLRVALARVRPLLSVHGHIHEDGGAWTVNHQGERTWVVNASINMGRRKASEASVLRYDCEPYVWGVDAPAMVEPYEVPSQ